MLARLALVALLVVVCVLAGAEQAMACSCVREPASEKLRGAQAAITGQVVEVRPVEPPPYPGAVVIDADYYFRVERAYKGGIRTGMVIPVRSNTSGASCGLGARVGDRLALVLRRWERRWVAGLCNTVEASELEWAMLAGRYVGRVGGSPRPKSFRLRVTEEGRVSFAIRTRCRRFSRASVVGIGGDGRFYYRETGRTARYTYRLKVGGKVKDAGASGTFALRVRYRDGSYCRVRANWDATRQSSASSRATGGSAKCRPSEAATVQGRRP